MSTTLLAQAVHARAVYPSNRSGAHEKHQAAARLRPLRIGLLGCGTIGSCFAATLLRERARMAADLDVDFSLVSILVRDPERVRGLQSSQFTDSFDAVLRSRPDVIVELLGGLEPATSHIRAALNRGVPVITANKSVIAHHGRDLLALATRRGTCLLHEAAVCAAVPILSVLEQLRGDRIRSIHGILNGSTNYVLTRMSTQPVTLSDALIEAKSRGLIEPDPSADLSGRDAAEKLTILARLAGYDGIDCGSIDIAGIEHISPLDILAARRAGCSIKLVAVLERVDGEPGGGPDARSETLSLRVAPMLVPRGHRLATVDHARNAVVIDAELGGALVVEGAGAGPKPTTSALLGDLLRIARLIGDGPLATPASRASEGTAEIGHIRRAAPHGAEVSSGSMYRHYVRVQVAEAVRSPRDVIKAFSDVGVAIKSIDLRAENLEVWTLHADTGAVRSAVAAITGNYREGLIAPVLEHSISRAMDMAANGAEAPPDNGAGRHAVIHFSRRQLNA